jgi:hypothetical protein
MASEATKTNIVRVGFYAAGLVTLVAGLLLTRDAVARLLAPDGDITEEAYVYALRGILAVAGVGLTLAGRFGRVQQLRRIALGLVAAAIPVAGLELTLRVNEYRALKDRPDTPTGVRASRFPGLIWENTPSFVEFFPLTTKGLLNFNSHGMRDDERVYSTDQETIVVVGDSIESWRERLALNLYPRRLEAMFNAEPGRRPVRVLNFGVYGYSLHQKILMLKYRGLEWKPSRAIVGYCLNDPQPSSEFVAYFTNRERPLLALRSLTWLNERVRTLLVGRGSDYFSVIHGPGTDTWNGVVTDLEELARLAREHAFTPVLLIFPLLYDRPDAYPWVDVHRRVADEANRLGILVVDLLESYERVGVRFVREDTVHPNERRHLIAAEQLYAAIKRAEAAAAMP